MYSQSCAARAALDFTAVGNFTKLGRMNSEERGISKRQLGAGLAILGALGGLGILAVDLLEAGRQGGIGPAQGLALLLMLALIIVGLSLLPLGDAPA